MRYFLAHLDDRPDRPWQASDPHEEIHVLPFAAKLAIAVPIGALRHALPLIATAAAEAPPACCPGCDRALPVSPSE